MDALDNIRNRRSFNKLSAPAPNDNDLQTMLGAAMFAPDHKELRPWQFIVLRDSALRCLGEVMASALAERDSSATVGQLDKERSKPMRAPVVIAVATKRVATQLPFVELICATAAATQNLLLAAHSLGFGAMWRTGDAVRDPNVKNWLDLSPEDELVGFIYIGTPAGDAPARAPIDPSAIQWRPSKPPRLVADK